MNWENLRSDEMKAAIERSGGLCVLPFGCMEKHGPHMPLGTDSMKAKACVEQAAEMEDVVVFPTGLWLGDVMSSHSNDAPTAPGYIGLSPNLLMMVLEELCDEIARNGFRKILIVNSHGGNKALLSFFLRAQGYKRKNYATMVVQHRPSYITRAEECYPYFTERREEYPMLTDEDMAVLKNYAENGGFGGGHADFSETANIMGYWPHLIAQDRYEAESGANTHRADYLPIGVELKGAWYANHPNAYDGKPPHGCSQTIGEAMNLGCARRLAEIFKQLKNDEECVRIASEDTAK